MASPHFSWAELDPVGDATPTVRANLARLAREVLEPVRAHYGRPVHITSGFRSTATQARLWREALAKYGSPAAARAHVAPPGHSKHETGEAADFWIAGVAPNAIASFLDTLPACGGIGIYPSWVHGDIRPRVGGKAVHW